MGNVSHKGKDGGGGLTKFQKRKLKYDFHTFFGKGRRASERILNADNTYYMLRHAFCGVFHTRLRSVLYLSAVVHGIIKTKLLRT